ncbi:MAG: crotonase/enoyl-CoA hydratase family protein [Alphaproteobacteria bacterium]
MTRRPTKGRGAALAQVDTKPFSEWSQPEHGAGLDLRALNDRFDLLELRYERSEPLLWCVHADRQRPCYTRPLLSNLLGLFAELRDSCSGLDDDAFPFRYLVWESPTPGIWNLGGDLALFVRLIEAGDVETLRDYAYLCVNTVYQNYTKSDLPYLTVALVQGDALGGGFEAVLSNDIVIAEEHCQFGLPEILFNMFPGMGAYSFLSRKLDAAQARSMILSGRLYSAQELCDLGLIDMVVPTGGGEAGLRTFLDRNRRRHRALLSMSRVARRCSAIDQDEMIDVADIWVENAMGISASDLRRMQRLIKAQLRRSAEAGAC